jgi:GNAT superfamily N-acetyltransferase
MAKRHVMLADFLSAFHTTPNLLLQTPTPLLPITATNNQSHLAIPQTHDPEMNHDANPPVPAADPPPPLRYERYDSAREDEYVGAMRQLISKDLSEPYSIYVYRYFLYQWGELCFMAMDDTRPAEPMVGVVVSKLEPHRAGPLRGYIAMLAVREEYRGRGIATKLVRMAIDAMIERGADEVCFHLFLSCFSVCHGADGRVVRRV